jgi:hypothetical protein
MQAEVIVQRKYSDKAVTFTKVPYLVTCSDTGGAGLHVTVRPSFTALGLTRGADLRSGDVVRAVNASRRPDTFGDLFSRRRWRAMQ